MLQKMQYIDVKFAIEICHFTLYNKKKFLVYSLYNKKNFKKNIYYEGENYETCTSNFFGTVNDLLYSM